MEAAQLTFVETTEGWTDTHWDLSALTIRGLSLTRPCPFAFVNGQREEQKRIENRPWKPPIKMVGRFIALHASQTWSDTYRDWIAERTGLSVPSDEDSPDSIIFAVCRLIGYATSAQDPRIPPPQRKWFLGRYGWLLDNLLALDRPVISKGSQRLWRFEPKSEVFQTLKQSYLETLANHTTQTSLRREP
jgi:hypothetical protein